MEVEKSNSLDNLGNNTYPAETKEIIYLHLEY